MLEPNQTYGLNKENDKEDLMKCATNFMAILLVAFLSPTIDAMEQVELYDGEQGRLVFQHQQSVLMLS